MLDENLKRVFLTGDPIIKFFLFRLRLKYWAIFIILIIWSFFVFFPLAYYLGALWSSRAIIGTITYEYCKDIIPVMSAPIIIGTLSQPGQLVISFFVQPVVIGYYFSFSQQVWDALERLFSEGTIPHVHKKRYELKIEKIGKVFNSPILIIIALLFGVGICAWVFNIGWSLREGNYWMHVFRWVFILSEIPRTFLTAFAISMIVLRVLVFQYALKKIYEEIPTKFHPLHEDGAGGYSSIGKIVSNYFWWLLAGFGFYASSGITYWFNKGEIPNFLLVQFVILPIAATVVFFLPLLSTHQEMQNAIKRSLACYSQKYDEIEKNIFSGAVEMSSEQLKEIDALIETVRQIRETSPSWPFDTQTLRNFFATLTTSILPLGFSLYEKFLAPNILK